jgi:putative flippase GtrA
VNAELQSPVIRKLGPRIRNSDAWQELQRVLYGRGSVGRYGIIGATGVTIDFLIFALLISAGMLPAIATTVSTLAGITNNYAWNSTLNFRLKLNGKRGVKFLTVGFVGLVTSAGLLQLLITLSLEPMQAKWLSLPLIAVGQFVANKFWTFR